MNKWLCREFNTSVILVEYDLNWNEETERWEFPSKDFVKFKDQEVFDNPMDAICHRIDCINTSNDLYVAALEESTNPSEADKEEWTYIVRNYKLALESAMKLYEEHKNV